MSGSSKASLHSKAFLFDRKHVFIGSLNLDPRSIHENTEIGVMLTAPELVSSAATKLDGALAAATFQLKLETHPNGYEQIVWHEVTQGKSKTYTTDPGTSIWQRFIVGFVGLLPVESQL